MGVEAVEGRGVCLGWAPVLIVSAAQFGGYADRALTAAFASDLQAQFALTDAQLGMLHGTAVIRSEEHTSELQSLMRISYAVFCLKKKTNDNTIEHIMRQNVETDTH